MSRILWLASYPKSGNTWLRVFIANMRSSDGQRADINKLGATVANNRQLFDEIAGVEASDLTEEEIQTCRPLVYRHIALAARENVFLKIHDAYTLTPGGEPLIPTDATRGAVYVVRNPLDVAISFARSTNEALDVRIAKMAVDDYLSANELPIKNLNQRLLSWSGHVLSWVDGPPFPVHVVRYEDMYERPAETFAGIGHFCDLSCDPGRLRQALYHSSFEQLQNQERERGFVERQPETKVFFRQGRPHAWREVLSNEQVERIINKHRAVMERFGYLPL